MIDVAHDGDDGRTAFELAFLVGHVEEAFLDVRFGDALDRMAHFHRDQFRSVGVDHVGDLVHLALAHHQTDDVHAAFRHAARQFLDGDRLGQNDFAEDLLLRLVLIALHALHAAAEGCDGARALLLLGGRAGHRQATAVLLFGTTRRLGDGRQGELRSRHDRTTDHAIAGWRTGRAGCQRGRRNAACGSRTTHGTGSRRRRRAFASQAAGGGFFGTALGFSFLLTAGVFLFLAGFGGFALGLLGDLARRTQPGVFLRLAAIVFFTLAGTDEGAGAGVALLLGQRAQDDARIRAVARRGTARSATGRSRGRAGTWSRRPGSRSRRPRGRSRSGPGHGSRCLRDRRGNRRGSGGRSRRGRHHGSRRRHRCRCSRDSLDRCRSGSSGRNRCGRNGCSRSRSNRCRSGYRCRCSGRCGCRCRLMSRRNRCWRDRLGGGSGRSGGRDRASLDGLDHDRFRAAMREALTDDALLHRALQRKRLRRAYGQGLVAGILRFSHMVSIPGPRPLVITLVPEPRSGRSFWQ